MSLHQPLLKNWLPYLLALTLMAACAAPATPSPSPQPPTPIAPSATPLPTTAVPTATASATATPSPTPSPQPPSPTSTATETPTRTQAPAATAAATTAGGNGDKFTPKADSVWEIPSAPDQMNGDCTGGSIVDVGFYGPVLITPQGNSLTWFNQASATYTFSRTGPDTYIYSGPDLTFDGAAAMTLRFTSAATFVMQRVFTPTNDSGCQHTYNYTGTFWYYR